MLVGCAVARCPRAPCFAAVNEHIVVWLQPVTPLPSLAQMAGPPLSDGGSLPTVVVAMAVPSWVVVMLAGFEHFQPLAPVDSLPEVERVEGRRPSC